MPYRRRRKIGRGARGKRVGRAPNFQRRKGVKRFLPRKMGYAGKTIIRQPSGIADSVFVKLKYTEPYTYSIVSGAGVAQVMRANSLFDPNFTGTGNQPYFFDQWNTLFQNYTVLGSKCTAFPFSNAGTAAYEVVVVPSTSSTGFGTGGQELIIEQPYARHRPSQINQPSRTVRNYMSTNKIYGIRKSQVFDDPNLSAAIGSNPATQWFWHIWANSMDSASTVTLSVRITVVYYVRFYNRQRPVVSA